VRSGPLRSLLRVSCDLWGINLDGVWLEVVCLAGLISSLISSLVSSLYLWAADHARSELAGGQFPFPVVLEDGGFVRLSDGLVVFRIDCLEDWGGVIRFGFHIFLP
jgi:hypothetical protein